MLLLGTSDVLQKPAETGALPATVILSNVRGQIEQHASQQQQLNPGPTTNMAHVPLPLLLKVHLCRYLLGKC